MKMQTVLLSGLLLGASLIGARAHATSDPADLRLQALEEKVRALEDRLKTLDSRPETAAPPVVTKAGEEGFGFASADGSFRMKFRTQLQVDGRFYLDDKTVPATNTFLVRKARPWIEASLYRWFSGKLQMDFGQGLGANGISYLQDAYLDVQPRPEFGLRAGKFKEPVGLERVQLDPYTLFVENALSTNLTPNRDIGYALQGNIRNSLVEWQAGVFNGVPDAATGDIDTNSDKTVAAKIFALPFKETTIRPLQGLGLGFGASWGRESGAGTVSGLPSFKTDGQQVFFSYLSAATSTGTVLADGEHLRFAPQSYYHWNNFGMLSEYEISSQEVNKGATKARIKNTGWQIAPTWVITGENASYSGVVPKNPFDPDKHQWGAFELAARWSELRVDQDAFPTFSNLSTSATRAQAWTLGLNWYLNRFFKGVIDFTQTRFTNGGYGGADRENENVLLTRLQFVY